MDKATRQKMADYVNRYQTQSLASRTSTLGMSGRLDGKMINYKSLTSSQNTLASLYDSARAVSYDDSLNSIDTVGAYDQMTSDVRRTVGSKALDTAQSNYAKSTGSSFSDPTFAEGLNPYSPKLDANKAHNYSDELKKNVNLGKFFDEHPKSSKRLYVFSGNQVKAKVNHEIKKTQGLFPYMQPKERNMMGENNFKLHRLAKSAEPDKAYMNSKQGLREASREDIIRKNKLVPGNDPAVDSLGVAKAGPKTKLDKARETDRNLSNLYQMVNYSSTREYDRFLDKHPDVVKPMGLKETKVGGRHYTFAKNHGEKEKISPLQHDNPSDVMSDRINYEIVGAKRRQDVNVYFNTPTNLSGKTKDKPNLQNAIESIKNPRNYQYLQGVAEHSKSFKLKPMLKYLRSDKIADFNDNKYEDKHDSNVIENFSKAMDNYVKKNHLDMKTLNKQYGQRFKMIDVFRENPNLEHTFSTPWKSHGGDKTINYNLALDKSDGYYFHPKMSFKDQPKYVQERNQRVMDRSQLKKTFHDIDTNHAKDSQFTIDDKMKRFKGNEKEFAKTLDDRDLFAFKNNLRTKGMSQDKFLDKHPNLKTRLYLTTDKGRIYSKNAVGSVPYNKSSLVTRVNMAYRPLHKHVVHRDLKKMTKQLDGLDKFAQVGKMNRATANKVDKINSFVRDSKEMRQLPGGKKIHDLDKYRRLKKLQPFEAKLYGLGNKSAHNNKYLASHKKAFYGKLRKGGSTQHRRAKSRHSKHKVAYAKASKTQGRGQN